MDYTMQLVNIAAGIVRDVMGNSMKVSTRYSADGNFAVMEFDGYPFYNSIRKGKVIIKFPRSAFEYRRGAVKFNPIQQTQFKYFQEREGKQLAHPHVFNDGHPCWDGSARNRPTDLIANIIETMCCVNVTHASVTVGKCASGIMETGEKGLANAKRHSEKVMKVLGVNPVVHDRVKLEKYVTNRWTGKLTMLVR